MILNIGCGSTKKRKLAKPGEPLEWGDDVIHLDNNPDHNPDVVWDLTVHPLPFEDGYFDEIHAYDVLEHLAYQGDYEFFFKEFTEYWRLLKTDGLFCALVPNPNGKWAYGDPSHKRVITPENLTYLSQQQYEEQVGITALSDFRNIYKADFKPIYATLDEITFRFVLQKQQGVFDK